MSSKQKIRLVDSTMRDGSHPMAHQFTAEQVSQIAQALDVAGIPLVEISHGDGLGGSSLNYGFSKEDEQDLIAAVNASMTKARITVLLLPGIGIQEDLKESYDRGARAVRVATHCTEADIAIQHIGLARDLGMETLGFLMMAHMISAKELVEQLKLMEGYGANCVYITDSAGYMLPADVTDRVALARTELSSETEIGFHGHHNLAMGIANSLAAVEAGASRIDGSLAGLGAGAGNTPLEVFIAVCERMGIETGVDLFQAMDIAEDLIVPLMDNMVRVDRDSLTLGYAGVYSSFLLYHLP